jgi:hypothetical protein
MNEKNLIPNSERTPSELREITSKGGKASGASRRKKRNMQETAKLVLSQLSCTEDDRNTLAAAGFDNIPPDDVDNMLLVNAALVIAAKKGDVNAYRALRDAIRDDDRLKIEKERLKLEKKKLAEKNDDSEVLSKLDDVLSKIGE